MNFKTFWRKKSKKQDKKADIINHLDSFKYKTEIETRFADFDMFGHVNNAVYFTYLEVARSKYWNVAIKWDWKKTGVVIAQASLDYLVPVLIDDKISMYVRTSRIGNSSFDLEYLLVKHEHGKEVVCSKGKTICVAFDYQTKGASPIPENERARMISFEQLENK
ncbi:acyl-CoA thioester hydrolase [Pedobacter steynii]|uniref:Acyl-CoA thioester hydrolase n=1 Tax=Pedobacter steynii TaxID=430522 RepID=A0A1H0J4G9_9SPHI|nr:thioesterase family protein [Pedobacter steynii]NQX43020.1 acyl-CoA thioesterase [Pedobacter steynii]SDO38241.1 acyl-CoA thioester hydrolase [Pedobacter steynii]